MCERVRQFNNACEGVEGKGEKERIMFESLSVSVLYIYLIVDNAANKKYNE